MVEGHYYEKKIDSLIDIFGARSLSVELNRITVDGVSYPIVDDVIILLDPEQYPSKLHKILGCQQTTGGATAPKFAADIQFTFGQEWLEFPEILPEHELEFRQYFDLVDLDALANKRVCDLGCGIGRWSSFLQPHVNELILIDFSEAVFVARRNLRSADNAIFLMGDIQSLPLRKGFADFVFCLGVLHHLPSNALSEVRNLKNYAPNLLVYLYSALDSRPRHYRALLWLVTLTRQGTHRVRNRSARAALSWVGVLTLYLPLIWIGRLLKPVGLSKAVPLYDFYHDKSFGRIRQDVYDRFFTRIEQRFSRDQILALKDTFDAVTVSDQIPYWHFLCRD